MAPYESESTGRRHKATRYVVPVAVVGVAAATIGLVPALADSGDPDLPKVGAHELIERIAASDVQRLSGTVKVSTDLGLPSLGGATSGLMPSAGAGGGSSSADPRTKLTELATGSHTLRVAADGPDRQKVSVLENAAEYSVIHNGDEVWAYDSASDEAYHAKAPENSGGRDDKGNKGGKALPEDVPTTPKELADEVLKASGDTTSITVDGTQQVAGRDAYKLVVRPKQSGSTVGGVTIAVDAKTGLPLKFTLAPAGGGAPVVDAGFTKIDYSRPAASTFDFQPPKGTKVTEEKDVTAGDRADARGRGGEELKAGDLDGLKVLGKGWTSVAELKLPAGEGLPTGGSGAASKDLPAEAQSFLDSLGTKASGDFGSGTVYSTRLINVLVTDDGTVYAGAVTKDALVKAADAAH